MTPPRQEGAVVPPPADVGVVATSDKFSDISTVAKDYYDSDNAFNFYRQVGGVYGRCLLLRRAEVRSIEVP